MKSICMSNKMRFVGKGDWKKASITLRDRDGWKGEYVGRRYQEGSLLMEVC